MIRIRQIMLSAVVSGVLMMGVNATEACADQAPSVKDITLEKLKAVNQANRAAVTTVVLHETVVESYRERPGEEREARERMTWVWGESRDDAIEWAVAHGANEDSLKSVQQAYEDQLASVEETIVVRQLNKRTAVARTSLVDFVHKQARYDDKDLRDLEELAANHGLNEDAKRYNLSKTRALILRADRSVLLNPAGRAGAVRSRPRFSTDLEASRLGVVPAWVLEGELDLSLKTVRDQRGPCVQVTGRKPGQTVNKVLVEVRPELGCRLIRLVTYDDEGNVFVEFRASDYRAVDGLLVPFKTETRRTAYGIKDHFVRQRTVESIRVNEPIKAVSFDVPDGYHVQDIRPRSVRLPGKP
jgi:hypothetical protein